MSKPRARKVAPIGADYHKLANDISRLVEQARQKAAQSVNAVLTATYWEVGRHIVEHEQGGRELAPHVRQPSRYERDRRLYGAKAPRAFEHQDDGDLRPPGARLLEGSR